MYGCYDLKAYSILIFKYLTVSPNSKTRSLTDSNVLACKARLEAIAKTTLEHFQKWGLTDKRGLQLCLHIESVKTKVLEQMNSSDKTEDFTLYPTTIKTQCDNLAIIASICRDISIKTKESLKQLKALSKLPGSCNEIFYRSWQLPEYVAFLAELSERYEKEAEVRLAVAGKLFYLFSSLSSKRIRVNLSSWGQILIVYHWFHWLNFDKFAQIL